MPTVQQPERIETELPMLAEPERRRPAVSIVIPCYRDEHNIASIFQRTSPIIDKLGGDAELVLVDDGSPDRTGAVAETFAARSKHPTTVVRLARNFGQHPAVFAGFAHARGKVVVTLDSDLQYPPEEIARLISELDDEHPVVSGYRAQRKDPFIRRWISASLTNWLGRRTGQQLVDYGSMFRAYDRTVIDQMLQSTEQHRFIPALVAWLGFRVKEIPVTHQPRGEGGSRYRMLPLIEMFLDLVTSYSVSPLRVLSLAGFVGAMLGFLATATFVVYRVIEGSGVSGTVSAFALVFLLLALQLLVVASLGEYVGRIYVETKGRPYFVVGKVTRNR